MKPTKSRTKKVKGKPTNEATIHINHWAKMNGIVTFYGYFSGDRTDPNPPLWFNGGIDFKITPLPRSRKQ